MNIRSEVLINVLKAHRPDVYSQIEGIVSRLPKPAPLESPEAFELFFAAVLAASGIRFGTLRQIKPGRRALLERDYIAVLMLIAYPTRMLKYSTEMCSKVFVKMAGDTLQRSPRSIRRIIREEAVCFHKIESRRKSILILREKVEEMCFQLKL